MIRDLGLERQRRAAALRAAGRARSAAWAAIGAGLAAGFLIHLAAELVSALTLENLYGG